MPRAAANATISLHVVLRIAQRVRQLRVLPDLEPPALVVDEVPVEAVQLVPRQRIQERTDLLLGKEVPGAVQQHPSPGEPGLVPDVQAGQLRGVRVQRQQLREALQAVEEPRGVGGGDLDAVCRDDQVVRLRSGSVRLLQDDRSRVRLSDAKRELRQRLRRAYEQLRNRPELGPSRGYGNRHLAGERQTTCRPANGCGNGDDGIHGCGHGTTSSITTGTYVLQKRRPYHHDVMVRPKPQGSPGSYRPLVWDYRPISFAAAVIAITASA